MSVRRVQRGNSPPGSRRRGVSPGSRREGKSSTKSIVFPEWEREYAEQQRLEEEIRSRTRDMAWTHLLEAHLTESKGRESDEEYRDRLFAKFDNQYRQDKKKLPSLEASVVQNNHYYQEWLMLRGLDKYGNRLVVPSNKLYRAFRTMRIQVSKHVTPTGANVVEFKNHMVPMTLHGTIYDLIGPPGSHEGVLMSRLRDDAKECIQSKHNDLMSVLQEAEQKWIVIWDYAGLAAIFPYWNSHVDEKGDLKRVFYVSGRKGDRIWSRDETGSNPSAVFGNELDINLANINGIIDTIVQRLDQLEHEYPKHVREALGKDIEEAKMRDSLPETRLDESALNRRETLDEEIYEASTRECRKAQEIIHLMKTTLFPQLALLEDMIHKGIHDYNRRVTREKQERPESKKTVIQDEYPTLFPTRIRDKYGVATPVDITNRKRLQLWKFQPPTFGMSSPSASELAHEERDLKWKDRPQFVMDDEPEVESGRWRGHLSRAGALGRFGEYQSARKSKELRPKMFREDYRAPNPTYTYHSELRPTGETTYNYNRRTAHEYHELD